MKQLLFGTAGIPIRTPDHNTENGIRYVRELGLDVMELEFVRSINISRVKAPLIKESALKNNIVLTCHAPYFVNLNAVEKPKLYASMDRVLNSARIASLCGGYSVTFHAGFYLGMDSEIVYNNIRDKIRDIRKTLDDEGVDIWLRPETTGKQSQFSGLKDLLKISQEVEGVMPCIDFAHMHARTGGKNNTYPEFRELLIKVEDALGKEGLSNMHIHMSGINYTEKG
ncbi:MAG: TIM barrel protein, partial [Nanoarchaeota archaeon]|nr:TIM barrel protein [Nanoarchaeota archaeon]